MNFDAWCLAVESVDHVRHAIAAPPARWPCMKSIDHTRFTLVGTASAVAQVSAEHPFTGFYPQVWF